MSGHCVLRFPDRRSIPYASHELARRTHAAIDRLIAQLQSQEEERRRAGDISRGSRGPRYRMVIDGPFIETKEFGALGSRASAERTAVQAELAS